MDDQFLIENIKSSLSILNPYKVILFGSFAYGNPDFDSDVDLIVVLNSEGYPANYGERMENHRIVRRLLRDINRLASLDVIVYTIGEWNSFIETGSAFSRLIIEKGKAIA